MWTSTDAFLEPPNRIGDIADQFDLRKVDGIDFGAGEVDVDHLAHAAAHEERRFLDNIVADIDDAVGVFDRTMHEIAVGQCGVAQPQRMGFVDHALAHLGGEKRNTGLVNELAQDLAAQLAVGGGADHQQRML